MARVGACVKWEMYVELVIVYRGRCVMCVGTCIVQYMGSVCKGEGGLSGLRG